MTAETPVNVPGALSRAQKLANLMDMSVRIPLLGVRFGLDFLIGLIPVLGDVISLLVGASIIVSAKQMGLPKPLLKKMLRNSLLDFLLGLIPFAGDLVDLFYKANVANVRIMEKWWLAQNAEKLKSATQDHLEHWQSNQD